MSVADIDRFPVTPPYDWAVIAPESLSVDAAVGTPGNAKYEFTLTDGRLTVELTDPAGITAHGFVTEVASLSPFGVVGLIAAANREGQRLFAGRPSYELAELSSFVDWTYEAFGFRPAWYRGATPGVTSWRRKALA